MSLIFNVIDTKLIREDEIIFSDGKTEVSLSLVVTGNTGHYNHSWPSQENMDSKYWEEFQVVVGGQQPENFETKEEATSRFNSIRDAFLGSGLKIV